MALQAIIKDETYSGLSDDLKKEYKKQQDGTYLLDVTPVGDFALENVRGLKSALASERSQREAAETKIKGFEGLDVDKAREALRKVEDMANWKPEDKVKEQIEAIKTQLTEKHKAELDKKDQQNQNLVKQLEKVMIDAEAVKAIAELKGSAPLLLPHVRGMTRMRAADDGHFLVEVVGTDGNARISPATNSTSPMTIAELIKELKTQDTFAPAFDGSGASGSGATGSGTARTKSGNHVLSYEEAKDPNKYRAAKEAASKAGVQLEIQEPVRT